MTYCIKCGKPTNNGIMCEDCIILDSPWLLAMKSKEADLVEQIEKFKAENAELRHRAEVAERAGKIAASKVFDYTYEEAVAQAERELAEESKNDKS